MTEQQDEHGRLKLHPVLDSIQLTDLSRLDHFPIEVLTLDGERVFCGVCTDYSTEQLGQYQELHIEAVTNSYLADITPKSLTFQSESKTLRSILEQVLGPYGVLMTLEQNPTISQMIYQQNETDWAFAKRIANQFGMSLFVNGKASGFQLNVGAIPFTIHAVDARPSDVLLTSRMQTEGGMINQDDTVLIQQEQIVQSHHKLLHPKTNNQRILPH